ncbi:Catechol 2,3-dioxygenase [Parasphingorhabdus marina DSM 22363]|uniref:Catechol 2,3-dioxygenase n=1 Tax=Parasphingorhabdus marina DSM 22363 TaxID=1123272 RepID=A0A1N6CMR1_9SPHN|nr:VOC family protein [Parasphingorhabdus marina]SIN59745.1 Catechol 2,3-dioxygenase [Parasphingorhabdus marina DSM 22363]
MKRLFAALAIWLGLAIPASAQTVSPWTETLVSVENLDQASRLFRELGSWEIKSEGKVATAELRYWKLPATASGRYQLICAPATETGCIRFVRLEGVGPQAPVRLALRAWDTGGIFSIMVRSDNVPQLFSDAIAMGWWAESQPIRFQFGTSDLRNVVLTGPHGINLAVYERITPDFTAFPVGRISQGFNSMRMVRDKALARAFYEQKLGFSVLFDSGREPPEPAPSNFGIPLNRTPDIKRSAAALQPRPGETGRVEVMQIEGFTGLDVSREARLPNLGIISVRYPVDDLRAYRQQIEARGVIVDYAASSVTIGAIGTVDLFAVRDPDGNITEFYQKSHEKPQ